MNISLFVYIEMCGYLYVFVYEMVVYVFFTMCGSCRYGYEDSSSISQVCIFNIYMNKSLFVYIEMCGYLYVFVYEMVVCVFFTMCGSTAVDTAMKIALAYHKHVYIIYIWIYLCLYI
jgi:4-aminobutyrate aminotransferase-like enzyme